MGAVLLGFLSARRVARGGAVVPCRLTAAAPVASKSAKVKIS